MLTLLKLRRTVSLAIGLIILQFTALNSQAQITLRPDDRQAIDPFGPSQTQSSRQKPVSRSNAYGQGSASLFGSSENSAPPAPTASLSDRDYEFQQLQREADALDRQLGHVRRIVKFAGPSIVHIEAQRLPMAGKAMEATRLKRQGLA